MDYVTQHDDQLLIDLHRYGPLPVRSYADMRIARRLQHCGKVSIYSRNGQRVVALRKADADHGGRRA